MIRSVIIAGSRTVSPTVEEIDAAIAKLDPTIWIVRAWTEVVCGMAPGGDLAGKAWAEARGKEVRRVPITTALVDKYGKYLAPKMRNRAMADFADAALIFWDGTSSGSADMCARMNARNKPVAVIPWHRRRRVKKALASQT